MFDLENRKCKVCGKDISDKRPQAVICDSKECAEKWKKIINSPDYHRYCEICGKNIDHLPKQKRLCEDPNCRKVKNKIIYHFLKTHEQTCLNCGEKFIATAKQQYCEKCRWNQFTKNLEDTEQVLLCKYCGSPIKTIIKKKTSKTLAEREFGVCDKCKEKHRLEISEKMKIDNPMFNQEYALKSHENRKKSTEEKYESLGIEYVRKEISEKYKEFQYIHQDKSPKETQRLYMQIYNPMKNHDIAIKVGETIRLGYKNGTYKKYIGEENWNYKGKRKFSTVVRDHLKEWIKQKLHDSDFQCELCGIRGAYLHVHHQEPLREIIQKTLDEFHVSIDEIEQNKNSELYLKIIDKIVEYHFEHPEIGIVVCQKCHDLIDQKYHKPKDKNEKNVKLETDPLF